jgi:NADH-quinone oxidoreductase subunit N
MTMSLLSLAGIPPLAGFYGKLLLLNHFFNYFSLFIFILIILSSVITISNYLKPLLYLNFYKINNIPTYPMDYRNITLPHPILISILTLFTLALILEPFEILNIFLHNM